MRRRVLLLVAATTSLVLVAFVVPLAILVRDVAADRAVQGAVVQTQSLSSLVATTDRAALGLAVQQADATSAYEISVFLADGTRLGAPAERSSLVELASRGSSASAEVRGGREIVFAVRDGAGGHAVIRAFVPDAELTRGVPRAWLLLVLLGLSLFGVSLLVADQLGRTLVRSTIELADVSHRLASGDLSARAGSLDSSGATGSAGSSRFAGFTRLTRLTGFTGFAAPDEIDVVGRALNHLAGRISELLREERETVADLSHRVRTPLTALRLDAEALPDPRDAARISAGVDAVQRAVTKAIEAARRRSASTGAGCDAAAVVRERVDFWAALAEDTGRELSRDLAPGPLPVAVGQSDLAACVDALLGNVFAHTPEGTPFAVRLHAHPDSGARLVIDDAGLGLPESSLLERGVSGAGSSGLGLDIVRRTAARAGGGMRLERSPSGGLRVIVDFPTSHHRHPATIATSRPRS